jgi:hypothetical protein
MHPGERVLFRIIGMGRDQHPVHHHSNHSLVIAWDGMPLTSNPAGFPASATADLGELAFSVTSAPGRTSDSIFEWTGARLGWDVYGDPNDPLTAHTCTNPAGFDPVTFEWCPDHGRIFPFTGTALPVLMPDQDDLAPGDFFSGSPFLGQQGTLPPGFGKFNIDGSFFQIMHSHSEKEMTNNDVFPGGMMTFIVITPRPPIP